MKTRKLILGMATLAILFSGCKKDTTTTTDTSSPTTDEAASTIGASVSSNGYGLTSQIQDAVPVGTSGKFSFSPSSELKNQSLQVGKSLETTAGITSLCGFKKDTVITRASSDTSSIQYSFYLHYNFMVNCTSNIPSSMIFMDSTSGKYAGPRITFNGSSTANTTLTFPSGAGDSVVVFNGTFVRNGSTVSKVGNKSTFTSKVTLNLVNLAVSKTTRLITSGTGTITISGTSSKGKTFTYTGTVDFSTKNVLAVNILGTIYHFDLRTGNEIASKV